MVTGFTRLCPLDVSSDRSFLSHILFKSFLFYFTLSNTYSLVLWSLQLIYSISRHIHISKDTNLSLSYFLNAQISDCHNFCLFEIYLHIILSLDFALRIHYCLKSFLRLYQHSLIFGILKQLSCYSNLVFLIFHSLCHHHFYINRE